MVSDYNNRYRVFCQIVIIIIIIIIMIIWLL